MTALQVTTVYQCVNIISNGIAANPLQVYERQRAKDGRLSKKVAYDHNLYYLLHTEPNPEMSSTVWRKVMAVHTLLWGNGYSEIQRDNSNRIIAIWPRNPARTRPVRLTSPMMKEGTLYPTGTLMYEVWEDMFNTKIMEQDSANDGYGHARLVLAEDMVHVPGLSLDGRLGQDVVILARQAIGLSLATEKYGSKFFGNGAVPQGVLGVPGDMTEIQWEVLKRSWAEAHGGENAHKTGVLPPGVTYTKTAATPEEGQMLQTRQYQRVEVASVFNVPGHMVGATGGGDDGGKSTVEQSSIEFLLFCLNPHIMTWEQEMERKLFPRRGQAANKYFAGFDTRKLMYPDAASRSTFYGSGKNWGYLCTNDIHELENMNPVEDGSGDTYWMPQNMQDAAAAAQHAQAVKDGLDDGTLAAVPSNTKPVGNHPVVKDQQKAQKLSLQAKQQATEATNTQALKLAKLNASQPADASGGKQKSAKQKRNDISKAFSVVFRDAVGRATFRKKPTVVDYVNIFSPLMTAMAELIYDYPVDPTEFVRSYTGDLFQRSRVWTEENLDAIAEDERERLITALERA